MCSMFAINGYKRGTDVYIILTFFETISLDSKKSRLVRVARETSTFSN